MTSDVTISVGSNQVIEADLGGHSRAGIVVFAHGSGSSRHSPRNRRVAEVLQEAGFLTVLLDLLTRDEEQRDMRTREHRFDIDLLTQRVRLAIDWLRGSGHTEPLGLFGASTGAAAALRAAAANDTIRAVVSRGGRPDLAGNALTRVRAPTLLIVGGDDPQVVRLNQEALLLLNDESSLQIVEGATHLFEEPGKLEEVADLAEHWFRDNLGRPG